MKYNKVTLKNGLRLVTVPMTGTETVTVVIMVGVGSRYETEKEAGLSHFIEHMFFKGTSKRPTTLDISSELDAVGGEFNAFTSKDHTGYYAKVDAKHVMTALDVVTDIYLNSKIEAEEIEKEKGAILQELNMYEDMPMRSVSELYEGLLYGKNPLGREIIGYKDTIRSFKRDDFINYMQRFYMANDTVVCVAGKFNESQIIKKISQDFAGMEPGEKPQIKPLVENQKKPEVKIKFKKTDQTHLIIGTRAYHQDHEDRYALGLLSVILGGNMSSRLFIEVREKRGLAYYVRTSVETFKDCGYIATQAGVEHQNLNLAVDTIRNEYRKIASIKVAEQELQKAKDYVKGKSVMGMEASDEVAMFHVDQEVTRGEIISLEEKFTRIDKVTVNDILRVAKDVFQTSKLNLAVIGPHEGTTEVKKLMKI